MTEPNSPSPKATPMAEAGELIARLEGVDAADTPAFANGAMAEAATLLASQEAEIEALGKELEQTRKERDEARFLAQCFSQVEKYTAMEARALAAEARVAEEREACARVAEEYDTGGFGTQANMVTAQVTSTDIAIAIRARGQSAVRGDAE